jgi:hypothetical protein
MGRIDQTMRKPWITACLLLLCLQPAHAQNLLVYREQTGTRVARVEVSEQELGQELLLRTVISYGESYAIQNNRDMSTLSFTYGNTSDNTSYRATREGNEIRMEGILKGKPFSKVSRIDANPLYESVERSLQGFALSGSTQTVNFWMVLPTEAMVFQMVARREGRETVEVAGEQVSAEKVKISLRGLAALLWSSLYWYRPTDGTFLRSEAVRGIGIIGVPKTVLELVEGERL